ncbi:MAG: hypothetical protein JJLCMIEE_02543 [Acidimicrobiales bacterium]|nr:MAG: nitroreductase family deazaflavin-dependent oxidoreductase [Actinomycetota bacterium]MBV6509452.1 hypothetical protein [Acidimicrobiales bacterium]RIK06768.1 MAG: nitroreductase family deazaflavin-dependent oxidoreductase [Acidobacteriota bacterium]
MPLPQALARFNRTVTNPVARQFAGRVRPLALVVHEGRKSGTEYRTPVMAFSTDDGWVIALTYGSDTDWVRNVQIAGGCQLEVGGDIHELVEPTIVGEETGTEHVPAAVKPALGLLGVSEFLVMSEK